MRNWYSISIYRWYLINHVLQFQPYNTEKKLYIVCDADIPTNLITYLQIKWNTLEKNMYLDETRVVKIDEMPKIMRNCDFRQYGFQN